MMNLLRVLIQNENRMEIWIDLIGDTKTYLNVLVFSKCFLEESKFWKHALPMPEAAYTTHIISKFGNIVHQCSNFRLST